MDNSPLRMVARAAVKNSVVISGFRTLGFASTLLIDIAIAALFGLSVETDAYFLALTIPRLITSILLASTNSVLVPIFTKVGLHEGDDRLWCVVSNLANLAVMGLGALGLLGALLSPLIMRGVGVALQPDMRQLATALSALLFLMVIPAGAIEVFTAALNSQRSFGLPEAVIVTRNLLTLAIVLAFGPSLGIYAVAIGHVVAELVQLLFLGMVLAILKGYRYRPTLRTDEQYTLLALRQLRYPTAGAFLGQSYVVAERFISSFLPIGSVSALAYARRIFTAINGIFSASVSTAFLPSLSAQFSAKNIDSFRQSLTLALKMALFLTVPLALGAMTLSEPLVRLLFGRGKVSADSVQMTATLFGIFAIGIPFMALNRISKDAYYSTNNTIVPFRNNVGMLVSNIVLNVTLTPLLGAAGLALGFSISLAMASAVLLWQLRRDIEFRVPDLTSFTLKSLVAASVMALAVYGVDVLFTSYWKRGVLISVPVSITIGIVAYLLVLLTLRVREMDQIVQTIKARFSAR